MSNWVIYNCEANVDWIEVKGWLAFRNLFKPENAMWKPICCQQKTVSIIWLRIKLSKGDFINLHFELVFGKMKTKIPVVIFH